MKHNKWPLLPMLLTSITVCRRENHAKLKKNVKSNQWKNIFWSQMWLWLHAEEGKIVRGNSRYVPLIWCSYLFYISFKTESGIKINQMEFNCRLAVGCTASYFVKIIWCSCWFCNTPPPYFEAEYCLFCGRRRVAVAWYRMICLVLVSFVLSLHFYNIALYIFQMNFDTFPW